MSELVINIYKDSLASPNLDGSAESIINTIALTVYAYSNHNFLTAS